MAGWATATGSIDLLGFLVGWIVFMWTPPHFWCLAIKAREEYASVNVPMLPVLVGNQKARLHLFKYSYSSALLNISVFFWARTLIYHNRCLFQGP